MPTVNANGWYKSGMRPLISIAGTPILDPWEYNATTSTIVDSGRNVKGYVIGAVIRSGVKKVEASWQYISAEEWSKILKLLYPEQGGNFVNTIEFYDQVTNEWTSAEMYCSDATSGLFLRKADGSIRGYKQARIAFIQI